MFLFQLNYKKNNMEDHYFIKLGDFYIDMNHVKEVKNSIQRSKFLWELICSTS
jgi:hypothetical protein